MNTDKRGIPQACTLAQTAAEVRAGVAAAEWAKFEKWFIEEALGDVERAAGTGARSITFPSPFEPAWLERWATPATAKLGYKLSWAGVGDGKCNLRIIWDQRVDIKPCS